MKITWSNVGSGFLLTLVPFPSVAMEVSLSQLSAQTLPVFTQPHCASQALASVCMLKIPSLEDGMWPPNWRES